MLLEWEEGNLIYLLRGAVILCLRAVDCLALLIKPVLLFILGWLPRGQRKLKPQEKRLWL